MNATVYNFILVLHITGIVLMAGATLFDFLSFKQLWKNFDLDKIKVLFLQEQISRFQKFMGWGMLLIILSGIGMMAFIHKVYGQQSWMQIKIVIVLVIIINGLGIRRRLGSKLNKVISETDSLEINETAISKIKTNLNAVHLVQFFLFLSVFVLSVFKFN